MGLPAGGLPRFTSRPTPPLSTPGAAGSSKLNRSLQPMVLVSFQWGSGNRGPLHRAALLSPAARRKGAGAVAGWGQREEGVQQHIAVRGPRHVVAALVILVAPLRGGVDEDPVPPRPPASPARKKKYESHKLFLGHHRCATKKRCAHVNQQMAGYVPGNKQLPSGPGGTQAWPRPSRSWAAVRVLSSVLRKLEVAREHMRLTRYRRCAAGRPRQAPDGLRPPRSPPWGGG